MDDINKESKQNLINEKIKEINSLRDQEIEDVDRKINSMKK